MWLLTETSSRRVQPGPLTGDMLLGVLRATLLLSACQSCLHASAPPPPCTRQSHLPWGHQLLYKGAGSVVSLATSLRGVCGVQWDCAGGMRQRWCQVCAAQHFACTLQFPLCQKTKMDQPWAHRSFSDSAIKCSAALGDSRVCLGRALCS